ncbi:ATP-grasp domain-containing protein [Schlesneria paludicola]|uniref:ATP-grasp domain-containing protein n=1 Tax=Schlesneria paludicola TaxID=360056 RepID=UPI000299D96F|nr:ATP-grasp domain-containing protein [Schlesneria paludicola]
MTRRRILIVGGSTRAAADSVRRAGWQPVCADLFADFDLRETAEVLPVSNYPESLPDDIKDVRADGWFYCGALENSPDVLERILANGDQYGPLLGADPAAVRCVRDPRWLAQVLINSGLPILEICDERKPPFPDGAWMQKPLASAGGRCVRIWDEIAATSSYAESHYFQRRVLGVGQSALLRVEAGRVECLGICQELEERTASRAPSRFTYCGSYGPVPSTHRSSDVLEQVTRIAQAVAERAPGLRGLMGLDFQWKDGIVWLVEVNPRYTASVEVLELAQGRSFLNSDCNRESSYSDAPRERPPSGTIVMKQILYANKELSVPDLRTYLPSTDSWGIPFMADIPIPGSQIDSGWPICTVLAGGETLDEVTTCLNERLAIVRAALDRVE